MAEQPLSVDLIARKCYFAVLEEYQITQVEVCRRTAVLQNLDPQRFTAVSEPNLSGWKHLNQDVYWRSLESLIFALAFPPTPEAMGRFFELIEAGFDRGLVVRALRKWDDDQPKFDRRANGG